MHWCCWTSCRAAQQTGYNINVPQERFKTIQISLFWFSLTTLMTSNKCACHRMNDDTHRKPPPLPSMKQNWRDLRNLHEFRKYGNLYLYGKVITWGLFWAPSSIDVCVSSLRRAKGTGDIFLVSCMSGWSRRCGSPRMCPGLVRSTLQRGTIASID